MVNAAIARLQDHGRTAPDYRPDRPGSGAEGHSVRRQHQEPRLQHVRARPAGFGQDHGRQGAPGTEGCRVADAAPTGPMSTISTTRTSPRRSKLPHGPRAKCWPRAWSRRIDELRNVLPALFEGEDYQVRRRAIDEQFRSGNEEALEALSKKAQSQNIAILRTPTGFTMAPMHEGKVVKPEVFNALPEAMRRDVETKIEALQKELGQSSSSACRRSDKKRRAQLSELNEEVAKAAIRDALDDLHRRLLATCPRLRRLSRCRRPRPGAQRRAVPRHGRGRERHRQAAGRHGARRALPPLHGQRDGLAERRHRSVARRSSRSRIPPTATSSAASSTSPRWARWSPTSF